MIVVDQGQSLIDVAIQHLGDATGAFDLALVNGLSITEKLVPGRLLIPSEVLNPGLVKYYLDNGYRPATYITEAGEVELPRGIDYWAIGIDFIVS